MIKLIKLIDWRVERLWTCVSVFDETFTADHTHTHTQSEREHSLSLFPSRLSQSRLTPQGSCESFCRLSVWFLQIPKLDVNLIISCWTLHQTNNSCFHMHFLQNIKTLKEDLDVHHLHFRHGAQSFSLSISKTLREHVDLIFKILKTPFHSLIHLIFNTNTCTASSEEFNTQYTLSWVSL